MRASILSILAAVPLVLMAATQASAIIVSPKGVNVNTNGPTTVFLTFIGLNDQRPAEALWCGAINLDQSCVPGTIFGRLPLRSDLSTRSGKNNFTDIMNIPASVARRAYQDAVQGNASDFFYVRRFISTTGGPDEFVAVTCRLAGGGARVPLALTSVRLGFAGSDRPILSIKQDETPPAFGAEITYNGTGRLKGRWEVVLPGDPLPTQRDLLTEATLPIEQRALQRHYTQIDTFDIFLPPLGRAVIPGPDPAKLPRHAGGQHLILLRIEATADREGNSQTGVGTVNSGGVAGFPLPVLRYYVGSSGEQTTRTLKPLQLLQPNPDARLLFAQPIHFSWQAFPKASFYKLEVELGNVPILSAVLDSKTTRYTAPPWLKDKAGQPLRWRVRAIAAGGAPIAESDWREFQIQN